MHRSHPHPVAASAPPTLSGPIRSTVRCDAAATPPRPLGGATTRGHGFRQQSGPRPTTPIAPAAATAAGGAGAAAALSSALVAATVAVVALARQLCPGQAFLLPPPNCHSGLGSTASEGITRWSGGGGQGEGREAGPLPPYGVRPAPSLRSSSPTALWYSLRERGSGTGGAGGAGGGGGGGRRGLGSSGSSGVADVESLLDEVETMQTRAFKEVRFFWGGGLDCCCRWWWWCCGALGERERKKEEGKKAVEFPDDPDDPCLALSNNNTIPSMHPPIQVGLLGRPLPITVLERLKAEGRLGTAPERDALARAREVVGDREGQGAMLEALRLRAMAKRLRAEADLAEVELANEKVGGWVEGCAGWVGRGCWSEVWVGRGGGGRRLDPHPACTHREAGSGWMDRRSIHPTVTMPCTIDSSKS